MNDGAGLRILVDRLSEGLMHRTLVQRFNPLLFHGFFRRQRLSFNRLRFNL